VIELKKHSLQIDREIQISAKVILFVINSLQVFKMFISSIIKLMINFICNIILALQFRDCVSSDCADNHIGTQFIELKQIYLKFI